MPLGSVAPALAQFEGGLLDGTPSRSLPNCFKSNQKQTANLEGKHWVEGLKRCPLKQQKEILSMMRLELIKQGNLLYQSGDFASAESLFSQLVQIAPQDAVLQYNLGNALYRQRKTEGAIAAYRQSIQLNPNHALAHNGLGTALLAQDQIDDAIVEFRAALKINPQYANALANLGQALWQQGKASEAISVLEQARALFEQQQEFQLVNQIDGYLRHIRAASSKVALQK